MKSDMLLKLEDRLLKLDNEYKQVLIEMVACEDLDFKKELRKMSYMINVERHLLKKYIMEEMEYEGL